MAKSDTLAKQAFRALLSKVYGINKEYIDIKNPTTDVIVKFDLEDESTWLYFELKTTSKAFNKSDSRYFGAISLGQWKKQRQKKDRYFFVFIQQSPKEKPTNFNYCIMSPYRIADYLTGLHTFPYLSVPFFTKEGEASKLMSGDDLEQQLLQIRNGKFKDTFPKNIKVNKERKKKIKKAIARYVNHDILISVDDTEEQGS